MEFFTCNSAHIEINFGHIRLSSTTPPHCGFSDKCKLNFLQGSKIVKGHLTLTALMLALMTISKKLDHSPLIQASQELLQLLMMVGGFEDELLSIIVKILLPTTARKSWQVTRHLHRSMTMSIVLMMKKNLAHLVKVCNPEWLMLA